MPDEINQASVRRFETRILANHPLTPTIYDLRVEHPHPDFTPGQFVNIYLNRGDWLLPRPISVADSGGGWIRLIYAVVGKGTERLSALQPGDKIDVTTILGHGFSIDSASTVIAVGGGVGVPPVYTGRKDDYDDETAVSIQGEEDASGNSRQIPTEDYKPEPVKRDKK